MRLLVTGTTGGIGGAVEEAALAAGHDVTAFNRDDFAALSTGADVAIPSGLGAVVFCTGCCPVAPLSKTSDELFAETLRVNCGLFLALVRHIVAKRLYSADGMRIVAVSSVSATEGWAGGAAYCASKGALSALCRALDAELKTRRISVAAIEPRYVKTKMFDACAGRMGVPSSAATPPSELAAKIMKSCTATLNA